MLEGKRITIYLFLRKKTSQKKGSLIYQKLYTLCGYVHKTYKGERFLFIL